MEKKKYAVLFTGGKDSCLALFLAKKYNYDVACLISVISENKESYMFHTPSISGVEKQAQVMGIPLIIQKTKGEKETELKDLEKAIKTAKKRFKIKGIITGAIESIYQASRVQNICNRLGMECFNPLWQKDQFELLRDLTKHEFHVILTGVFAYPLNKQWLKKKINKDFIKEISGLNAKYKINPAGEGGEFETFVLYCPLFKRRLKITGYEIKGEGNSYSMEIKLK